MSLSEFFEEDLHNSPQIRKSVQNLREMPDEDIRFTYELVLRLREK